MFIIALIISGLCIAIVVGSGVVGYKTLLEILWEDLDLDMETSQKWAATAAVGIMVFIVAGAVALMKAGL